MLVARHVIVMPFNPTTHYSWGGQTGIWTFLELIDGRPSIYCEVNNQISTVGQSDFRMAQGKES